MFLQTLALPTKNFHVQPKGQNKLMPQKIAHPTLPPQKNNNNARLYYKATALYVSKKSHPEVSIQVLEIWFLSCFLNLFDNFYLTSG